eukprot:g26227.t1
MGNTEARKRAASGSATISDDTFMELMASGTPDKQYEMGSACMGHRKERGYARQLLQAAANAGHADAQYALAGMLWQGQGGTKDRPGAVKLLLSAAEKGHGDSAWNLSKAYSLGVGVAKDLERAEHFRLQAEQIAAKNNAASRSPQKPKEAGSADEAQDDADADDVPRPSKLTLPSGLTNNRWTLALTPSNRAIQLE